MSELDSSLYDSLVYLSFEEASILVEKGTIEFRLKNGAVMKVTANALGDGIKRLVSFFKDLKKEMEKHEGGMDDPLESYMVEKLLDKHEIDLEGL